MVLRTYNKKIVFLPNELAKLEGNLLGLMLYRGFKARAVKNYDEIFWLIKKKLKTDPVTLIQTCFERLKPIFLLGNKTVGKRIVYVPIPAFARRKYVVVFDWIFRQLKGKSNTRGVNLEQLVELFSETSKNRGIAIKQQLDFYKKGLYNRHFMWKPKKSFVKFKPLQKRYGKRKMRIRYKRQSINIK